MGSIELFMEWYCSLIYWLWFRFLIVYEAPNLKEFIMAISIHFVVEFLTSTMWTSRCFYSVRMRVFHVIGRSDNGCDSTIDEWNIRNVLDIVTHFFAAMISGVVIIGYLIVIT